MLTALSIVALLLVAVAMGLSLAHALEFPGKLRLDEVTYVAVQAIYYPGFTIGGIVGELGGLVTLVALLLLTPTHADRFVWVAAALAFLAACHLTYWLVTHRVNQAWLAKTDLGTAGRMFFGRRSGPNPTWRDMRSIWEWSHVARAGFAFAALIAMTAVLVV